MTEDPYAVLGVPRDADQDTIRKQFRKLARQYHPDRNKSPGAEEQFKRVSGAYDIVGEEDKRRLWDEFGELSLKPGFDPEKARAWKQMGGGPGGFPGGFARGGGMGDFGFGGGGGGVNMEDILSSIFGGDSDGFSPGLGGRATRGRRGRDQRATMDIDFMQSVLGDETTIRVPRPDGSTDTLTVRIPAGVKDGGKLRLRGQGAPPPGGGECGDLLLTLRVAQHPLLEREGDDLVMEVPITVLEAMKGGSITVPTPTGDVKVTLPAGVRSGQRLRLRGKGVQKRGTPGDLFLVLCPTVPESEDPAMVAAAEALESAYSDSVRAGLRI